MMSSPPVTGRAVVSGRSGTAITCRSLVETKMHCFKRQGERVMAHTFERQVAELQVRATLLNRFSQLGRPMTPAVG